MNVLVVCLSNSGRSPAMEGFLRYHARHHNLNLPIDEVHSAGIGGPEGSPDCGMWDSNVDDGANQYVVGAMRRNFGIDIGSHRATMVQSLWLHEFDCILVMDENLRDRVISLGADSEKVKIINAEGGGIPDPDPYGSDLLEILHILNKEAKHFVKRFAG